MKTCAVALLACVLATSVAVRAQEAEKAPVSPSASKPLVVFGRISEDGKKLLSDLDSEWIVSNPEMLKGLEGRLVRVKCYVDSEKNRLRILFVKKENSELSYATRQADSAFRR